MIYLYHLTVTQTRTAITRQGQPLPNLGRALSEAVPSLWGRGHWQLLMGLGRGPTDQICTLERF